MALDRFVGVPYVDRGRALSGADCWGLLWLVYRDELGIELPSYAERYVTAADRAAMDALIRGELGAWSEVPRGDERAFDGVLMREGSFVRHIGVVADQVGRLLHTSSGHSSRIERYGDRSQLQHRVVGFFRHRNMVPAA